MKYVKMCRGYEDDCPCFYGTHLRPVEENQCQDYIKNNQPERLSEKTYYRNEDGTYPNLEPCIGSDSLNSMET